MFSRSAHRRSAWSCDCATAASRAAPASTARPSASSTSARARRRPPAASTCSSTYHGMAGQRVGQVRDGACATAPNAKSLMSSKPVRRSPSDCFAARSSVTALLDVVHAGERGHLRRRRREQLQHRRGDDAERALGADEQLLEIVAGVVLAQSAQAVPDAAVGEHDFEPQRQFARVAEAQHGGAAGVGRQVAADRAASLGAERQREVAGRPPRPPPARRAA